MTIPSAAELRAAAKAELAFPGRYQLHVVTTAPQKSWMQLAWEWLYQRWEAFAKALFSHIHVDSGTQSLFGDLLVVIFLVIVALGVAWIVRSLQISRNRSRALKSPLAAQRSAHAMWVRASDAAAAGDYATATRLLFGAAVTLLDLRGVVHDDASATVNELRNELHERNTTADAPFIELARGFTKAAYAERPVERVDWESARHAYHVLAELVNVV